MHEYEKAKKLLDEFLKRSDIEGAYAIVGKEDAWYDTITTVHNSLAKIQMLPHEDLSIVSEDGLTLKGIFYPAEHRSDRTVVCIHGYKSHAEREWAFPGLFYHDLGYNVLIPYLRAHGPSHGEYITFGGREKADILKWIGQINRMHPSGSVYIHGFSMGGGIALLLDREEIPNVKGILADAPCTSMSQIIEQVCMDVFKDEDKDMLSYAKQRFEQLAGVGIRACEVFPAVSAGNYPLFLTAGSNEEMEAILLQLQKVSPKETIVCILPGCDHGNGMYIQTALYQNGIRTFISKCE